MDSTQDSSYDTIRKEGRNKKLSREQMYRFIRMRSEADSMFLNPRNKKGHSIRCWNKLHKDLGPDFEDYSGKILRKMWSNLIQKYKELRNNPEHVGNPCSNTSPSAVWPYYNVLHHYICAALNNEGNSPSTAEPISTSSKVMPKLTVMPPKVTIPPANQSTTPPPLKPSPKSSSNPETITLHSEMYNVQWSEYSTQVCDSFAALLEAQDLVDVTLAAEGKYIQVHKFVLSVCSDYFKELFKINPCQHPIVILQDVDYDSLNSIIKFMYTGQVQITPDKLSGLLRIGNTLNVKGLNSANLMQKVQIPNIIKEYIPPITITPDTPIIRKVVATKPTTGIGQKRLHTKNNAGLSKSKVMRKACSSGVTPNKPVQQSLLRPTNPKSISILRSSLPKLYVKPKVISDTPLNVKVQHVLNDKSTLPDKLTTGSESKDDVTEVENLDFIKKELEGDEFEYETIESSDVYDSTDTNYK